MNTTLPWKYSNRSFLQPETSRERVKR